MGIHIQTVSTAEDCLKVVDLVFVGAGGRRNVRLGRVRSSATVLSRDGSALAVPPFGARRSDSLAVTLASSSHGRQPKAPERTNERTRRQVGAHSRTAQARRPRGGRGAARQVGCALWSWHRSRAVYVRVDLQAVLKARSAAAARR